MLAHYSCGITHYLCGISLSQTLFASPLLFPVTSMTASIHAFLLENSTCQASTDSTKEFPIIPTDATTASMIISVYNLFGFLLRKTEYKRILKCFYTKKQIQYSQFVLTITVLFPKMHQFCSVSKVEKFLRRLFLYFFHFLWAHMHCFAYVPQNGICL